MEWYCLLGKIVYEARKMVDRDICINMDRDLLILGDKNMGIYIYPLTFSD